MVWGGLSPPCNLQSFFFFLTEEGFLVLTGLSPLCCLSGLDEATSRASYSFSVFFAVLVWVSVFFFILCPRLEVPARRVPAGPFPPSATERGCDALDVSKHAIACLRPVTTQPALRWASGPRWIFGHHFTPPPWFQIGSPPTRSFFFFFLPLRTFFPSAGLPP